MSDTISYMKPYQEETTVLNRFTPPKTTVNNKYALDMIDIYLPELFEDENDAKILEPWHVPDYSYNSDTSDQTLSSISAIVKTMFDNAYTQIMPGLSASDTIVFAETVFSKIYATKTLKEYDYVNTTDDTYSFKFAGINNVLKLEDINYWAEPTTSLRLAEYQKMASYGIVSVVPYAINAIKKSLDKGIKLVEYKRADFDKAISTRMFSCPMIVSSRIPPITADSEYTKRVYLEIKPYNHINISSAKLLSNTTTTIDGIEYNNMVASVDSVNGDVAYMIDAGMGDLESYNNVYAGNICFVGTPEQTLSYNKISSYIDYYIIVDKFSLNSTTGYIDVYFKIPSLSLQNVIKNMNDEYYLYVISRGSEVMFVDAITPFNIYGQRDYSDENRGYGNIVDVSELKKYNKDTNDAEKEQAILSYSSTPAQTRLLNTGGAQRRLTAPYQGISMTCIVLEIANTDSTKTWEIGDSIFFSFGYEWMPVDYKALVKDSSTITNSSFLDKAFMQKFISSTIQRVDYGVSSIMDSPGVSIDIGVE